MEFYEFIETVISYIPSEFEKQRHLAEIILPWILGICTAATCFFGHTVHKLWKAFFFFGIGFIIPMIAVEALFAPNGILFWICAVLCAGIGVTCAVYSKKIFRVQLFITTLIMVFISVPSYLSFLGDSVSIIAGFIIAVLCAVLSIKYKYIMVIITTSFSGSFMLFDIIGNALGLPHTLKTIFAVIIAFFGLTVQCYVEREELKETHEHLKKRSEQLKNAPDNIKNKIKSDKTKPLFHK